MSERKFVRDTDGQNEAVTRILRTHGELTVDEIADATGMHQRAARRAVIRMLETGALMPSAEKYTPVAGRPAVRYHLTSLGGLLT